MRTSTTALSLLSLLGATTALPTLSTRQSNACFIVGTNELPAEVADVVTSIQNRITCSANTTTIGSVPDVSSNGVPFSSIDFSTSDQTPLAFALDQFATETPLADTDLQAFQDMLNVYLATEAGLRSTGGSLAIKVPKFFLQMQISRIQTAQGKAPKAAGQQVDHLRIRLRRMRRVRVRRCWRRLRRWRRSWLRRFLFFVRVWWEGERDFFFFGERGRGFVEILCAWMNGLSVQEP
jgi:hypothetical protein